MTVIMIVAWVLIMRRACVPASDDFHAEVALAGTELNVIAPPGLQLSSAG